MRISNPLLWKFPDVVTAALYSASARVPALGGGEKAILLAVIVSACLDVLTNIIQYSGAHSSAVPILKGMILILVIGSFRTLYSYLVTLGFFSIFVLRELNIVIEQNVYFTDDTVFFLRILFFVTWLLLFYEKRERSRFFSSLLGIFLSLTVLSVICQVAGMIFHVGLFKAYTDERAGYKGLFLAENDTSVFYLLALIYAMFLWRAGRRLYVAIVLLGLILLGMGSKTALLGALIVPIVYFFFIHTFYSPFDFRALAIRYRVAIRWTAFFFSIGIAGYFGVRYLYDILSGINYMQLLRVYEESGLLSSLLSFRDVKVAAYLHSIQSVPEVLFGLQARTGYQEFGFESPGSFMYEIDLFDYLARVGVVGVLLTVFLIWQGGVLRMWRSRTPELKTLIVTVLILGCTVGHTLISSMNGPWIAALLIAFGVWMPGESLEERLLHARSPQSMAEIGSHPFIDMRLKTVYGDNA